MNFLCHLTVLPTKTIKLQLFFHRKVLVLSVHLDYNEFHRHNTYIALHIEPVSRMGFGL